MIDSCLLQETFNSTLLPRLFKTGKSRETIRIIHINSYILSFTHRSIFSDNKSLNWALY